MTRRVALCVFLAATLNAWANLPETPRHPRPGTVRLLVPTFDGEGGVGANVSTILNLQIWRTLKVPSSDSKGEVARARALRHFDPKAAREVADRNGSQLILWGKAFRYADETIVQAYLDIPERYDPSQKWMIEIRYAPDERYEFEVDLPAREYEFEPIVLPNALVDRYKSIEALKVYDQAEGGKAKGVLGARDFHALSDDGDAILISYRNANTKARSGYIRVPELASIPSEIVDFTGAMIRILRGDWAGAVLLLDVVLFRPETPTAIRIDAHLLRAMALAEMGQSWANDAARAEELNPYLASTARYLIMLRVHEVERRFMSDPRLVEPALLALSWFVDSKRSYFEEDDDFIREIDSLIKRHGRHRGGQPSQ